MDLDTNLRTICISAYDCYQMIDDLNFIKEDIHNDAQNSLNTSSNLS